MAVIVLKHAEKYAGTHAERLAMDVSRVSLGSTFFEWDTSELFTFSPTGWVDKIGQVAGSMQLSGSKAEVKLIALSSAAEIAVGATEILQTTVPTGKKWTILDKGFIMNINPNATSGTISFESRISSVTLAGVFGSPYNKRIQFAYNAFFDASTGQYITGNIAPKDEAAQASLFKGLVLGNNINIDFRFKNNTDAPYPAGSGSRFVYLLVLEEVIS